MEEPTPDPYPEHSKLKVIQQESQSIGAFLEWLDGTGVHLARYEKPTDNWMTPVTGRITDLLAQYFNIDQKKLESEKVKMIDEQRELNRKAGIET